LARKALGSEKPLGACTPAAAAGMQPRDEKFNISETILFASEVMQYICSGRRPISGIEKISVAKLLVLPQLVFRLLRGVLAPFGH
tara:strand:+ start:166 stop:420 length:255 start_codon:yes stop_codon:yes gene_type:complete